MKKHIDIAEGVHEELSRLRAERRADSFSDVIMLLLENYRNNLKK